MKIGIKAALLAALVGSAGAAWAATPLTPLEARQSLVGRWHGKLEYRDYQADRWFGLPVKVEVRDAGDGVTMIRTADFDDGPATGVVRITTVSMLDGNGVEETSATFRKGRAVELSKARLALAESYGSEGWTLVESSDGTDDDRPAKIRLTTTHSGDTLVTLKEVDFSDDTKVDWLVRNKTTLRRVR